MQSDLKVCVQWENDLFIYKAYSIWAPWAFGQKNDLYLLFFRQRRLSTLLKRNIQLISMYGDF